MIFHDFLQLNVADYSGRRMLLEGNFEEVRDVGVSGRRIRVAEPALLVAPMDPDERESAEIISETDIPDLRVLRLMPVEDDCKRLRQSVLFRRPSQPLPEPCLFSHSPFSL